MKIRIIEEDVNGINLLCPYVVCEGCNEEIRGGKAIVVRDIEQMKGDVELRAYHGSKKCDPGGGWWRDLGDILGQLTMNSVTG